MVRRFLFRALMLGGLLIACTSPTLPLPPPALPSITASAATPNTYHLQSDKGALPNALIISVNRDTNLTAQQRVTGTLADANGTWTMDIFAKPGDVLDLTQESGSNSSPDTEIDIPQ